MTVADWIPTLSGGDFKNILVGGAHSLVAVCRLQYVDTSM
jgi:hypothetical protein